MDEARLVLRTKNDKAHQLGLPLPAGQIALLQTAANRTLLVGEAPLRDTADDEEVDLPLATSPDVRVRHLALNPVAGAPEISALTPELLAFFRNGKTLQRIEISNAKPRPVNFELRLQIYGAHNVVAADAPMDKKDGRPIFRLLLPANSTTTLHYVVD